MLRPRSNARVLGPATIVAGVVCIQVSAATAEPVFGHVGVLQVAGGRFLVGALLLVALVRPHLRGRSRAEWVSIAVYGTTMAVMTSSFYGAVDRLPLGTAATIFYLGPFAVAVAYIRKAWEVVLPVMGLVGVVLVARPGGGSINTAGVVFSLIAALALAMYTVFAQRVGHTVAGFDGLALSASVAALIMLPLTVTGVPRMDPTDVGAIALAGVLGIGLGFGCDFIGIRLSSARVAATLYSLEPAVAAVVGAVLLDQVLPGRAILGMVLVVIAGILAATTIAPPDGPVTEAV